MEIASSDGVVGDRSLETFVPSEKPTTKFLNDLLDGEAQPVADTRSGFERALMIALKQRLGRFFNRTRQARDVQEAIENGEVGEQFFAEHPVEIEIDVGELDEPSGISEQAQELAVRYDTVKVLGEVQKLLQMRVRTDARAGRRFLVE